MFTLDRLSKMAATRKKAATKKTGVRKIGSATFNSILCSTNKKRAIAAAEKVRKQGYKARVLDNGNTFCVYKSTKLSKKKK